MFHVVLKIVINFNEREYSVHEPSWMLVILTTLLLQQNDNGIEIELKVLSDLNLLYNTRMFQLDKQNFEQLR